MDTETETIEQSVLQGEDYQSRGIWSGIDPVESTAVAGFRIPAKAMFDAQANIAALAISAT